MEDQRLQFAEKGEQYALYCSMKRTQRNVLGLTTAVLALLPGHASQSQTNRPTPDAKASLPSSLVSSPLITVRLHPRVKDSSFPVPNWVDVYVKSSLKPVKVELWTGPTGTGVAESFFRISSSDHSVSVVGRKKFSFTITDCKQVGMVLEPRVYVTDSANPYSVYVGPFECKTQ
jgi:hypothetical protein